MEQPLLDAVWDRIPKLVASGRPVSECMHDIASACNELEPHVNWERFGSIDYDASNEGLQSWLLATLRESPPPFPVHGLFFPLVSLSGGGAGVPELRSSAYAIRMAGSSPPTADEHRLAWIGRQDYVPAKQYLRPPALTELSSICKGSISTDYVMPLAYVAVAVRALLDPHTPALFASDADEIQVVAGWEDADFYEIGQLTKSGFQGETTARI